MARDNTALLENPQPGWLTTLKENLFNMYRLCLEIGAASFWVLFYMCFRQLQLGAADLTKLNGASACN